MSTMPSFNISSPLPFWAMPEKALLLSTKSVWLLRLRSVSTTVVPSLLQTLGFLHLICINMPSIDYKTKMLITYITLVRTVIIIVVINMPWCFWFAYKPESSHHNRLHLWRERPHQLQGFHHLSPVPETHTHMPQLIHTQNSHKIILFGLVRDENRRQLQHWWIDECGYMKEQKLWRNRKPWTDAGSDRRQWQKKREGRGEREEGKPCMSVLQYAMSWIFDCSEMTQ